MTAKEYLKQVRFIDKRIDSKLSLVNRLRDTAESVTTTLSDMPRSDSPNLQRMEDTISKIVDLENDISHDIDKLVELKREVGMAISELSNSNEQLVLTYRYIDYRTWRQIAGVLDYSIRHVIRLHGQALLNFRVPA